MAGLQVSGRVLYFPERIVTQIHGSKAQLLQASLVLNMIAELRRAKTTAAFFDGLDRDRPSGKVISRHACCLNPLAMLTSRCLILGLTMAILYWHPSWLMPTVIR